MKTLDSTERAKFIADGVCVGNGPTEKGTWYSVYERNGKFAAVIMSEYGPTSGEIIRPSEVTQYVDLKPGYAHLEAQSND